MNTKDNKDLENYHRIEQICLLDLLCNFSVAELHFNAIILIAWWVTGYD